MMDQEEKARALYLWEKRWLAFLQWVADTGGD